MRRTVGTIMIGFGAFLVALAPLVKFYVAKEVIAAPIDLYQRTTLRADDATYLDASSLKVRSGATLVATNTTRGDVRASTDTIAVWDSFTSIENPKTGKSVEVQSQRVAFDRRTGRLTNTHGASVGDDTHVKQSGIGLFWPIDVQKKTYQYFDVATKRAWPASYVGEDTVHGVKAYKFVQHIPPTKTQTIKGFEPISLLGFDKPPPSSFPGLNAKTGGITVDRYYQATVTVWVDPRTGARINQEQQVKSTLRTRDGVDRVTVAQMDLKMTDASQKALIKRSSSQAWIIPLLRVTGPLAAVVLGVASLAVGLVMVITGRERASVTTIPPSGPGTRTSTSGPPARG